MVEAEGRAARPLLAAVGLVGLVLSPLLVGVEPVGGDPSRIFRPIKSELARALAEGRLPFWSDRFGTGVPLLAESHAAALYPPNWVLYRTLDVSTAYRLAMWLHHLGLAAATFAYARRLRLTPWGAGLAAIAACFGGPQTIHSSHEWMYHTLPFLPLALLLADLYVETGRASWLALLALCLGTQWLVGHYQLQTWTNGLVLLTGAWRVVRDRRPAIRAAGLVLAVGWGGAIASAQLGPSWELARVVGFDRRAERADLRFYSFPPAHWAELAVPGAFRAALGGSPESAYWMSQETTGFEASLYVGTAPVILAIVGLVGGRRPKKLDVWCAIVPLSFAVATLPRWWPSGFDLLMRVPVLNLFRAPARYTFLTAFGLALLAGSGLDRTIRACRFRLGIVLALGVGLLAFGWSWSWLSALGPGRLGTLALWSLPGWLLTIAAIAAWRLRPRPGAPLVLATTAAELAFLYYTGTTTWGWSVPLPGSSPLLTLLSRTEGVGRVGGEISNLPVLAGLTTATPYLGFDLPMPNPLLKAVNESRAVADPAAVVLLRRLGVTHLVWSGPVRVAGGEVIREVPDPALDRLAYRPEGSVAGRPWRVVRLPWPWPEIRAATRARVVSGAAELNRALVEHPDPEVAWFLASDAPPEASGSRATRAEVVAWDGREAVVEHDGPIDLIITRTQYPGWRASVDGGPWMPTRSADGGLQAVRVEGSGTSRVRFRFLPTHFGTLAAVSIGAAALAATLAFIGAWRRRRDDSTPRSRESPAG